MKGRPFDVAVVGGGPAGLATAIASSERGLSVCVVEAKRPPIDKACGEGIMPSGVRALADLGVEEGRLGGFPFYGIRYVEGSRSRRESVAEGRFRHGHGLGVRRVDLHSALVDAASRRAIDLAFGVRASGLTAGGVATDRGEIAARFVVGADGLHSRVRRWAGLSERKGPVRRYGLRRHFAISPWSELVEIHLGNGAEAYVTPVGGAEVGVAILSRRPELPYDEALDRFPRLASRLRGARTTSDVRGAGPFDRRVGGVVMRRMALVGDAARYVDPLTGEGIGLAVRQGRALAEAIATGSPARYAADYRRLVRGHEWLTRGIMVVNGRRRLRSAVLRTISRSPRVLSRVLSRF